MLVRNEFTVHDAKRFRIEGMALKFRTHCKRLCQTAGPVGKIRSARATTTHRILTSQRLKGSNQHTFRDSYWSCNCVEAPVHTVIEVDIDRAWRTE